MNLIYFLLGLAIVIPVLALVGHLYVAYKYAPERAKKAIMDALVKDQDFQSDLVKTLLNNLFKEIQDGDRRVIPVDAIIARAKTQFGDWIKAEMPKADAGEIMPVQYDDQGNPVQDFAMNALMSQIPKKYRGYAMMIMRFMQNR